MFNIREALLYILRQYQYKRNKCYALLGEERFNINVSNVTTEERGEGKSSRYRDV